jgi:predicted anti-sigma-YlaC factor YlaD
MQDTPPADFEYRIAKLERQVASMRWIQFFILLAVLAVPIWIFIPGLGLAIGFLICLFSGAGLVGVILKTCFPRLKGM